MGEPELDVSKPNIQMLFQDLAQTRRDLQNEYRESARKISDERERSRSAIEHVQKEFSDKVRVVEKENEALARALGRFQSEVDRLREENAILKAGCKGSAVVGTNDYKQVPDLIGPSDSVGTCAVYGHTPAPPVLPKVVVVPPSEPMLGKSVPISQ